MHQGKYCIINKLINCATRQLTNKLITSINVTRKLRQIQPEDNKNASVEVLTMLSIDLQIIVLIKWDPLRAAVAFHFNTLWKVLEEGGRVAVRSTNGELLELGGELRKVSVVVGVGVKAGVNVVRHVAGAVVQVCCKKEKLGKHTFTLRFNASARDKCSLPNYVQNYLRVIDKMNKVLSITAVTHQGNIFLSCWLNHEWRKEL